MGTSTFLPFSSTTLGLRFLEAPRHLCSDSDVAHSSQWSSSHDNTARTCPSLTYTGNERYLKANRDSCTDQIHRNHDKRLMKRDLAEMPAHAYGASLIIRHCRDRDHCLWPKLLWGQYLESWLGSYLKDFHFRSALSWTIGLSKSKNAPNPKTQHLENREALPATTEIVAELKVTIRRYRKSVTKGVRVKLSRMELIS